MKDAVSLWVLFATKITEFVQTFLQNLRRLWRAVLPLGGCCKQLLSYCVSSSPSQNARQPCCIYYIHILRQSRSCTADHALSTRAIFTEAIHLTDAKFKPLIFSILGFALRSVWNIFIVIISYD